MGNRTADYAEYIDITTGAIRRKRTGLLLRDAENIFIADNNIPVPKSVKDNFLSQIQSDLPISQKSPVTLPKPLCNQQVSIILNHQNIFQM